MATKTKNRYLVLVSGMLMQLCAGIIYMWSIFGKPVSVHLSWDANSASLTFPVMLATFVLGIILGGRMQDKIGPKPVAILGSVLFSLGMFLSVFVPASAPWIFYLTYGTIGGFGVGVVYTTTVSTIQKWFPDKRGFATGMMVSAFGASLVVFAPLTTLMLEKLGVTNTFLLFAGVFLVVLVGCSLPLSNPSAEYLPKGAAPSAAATAKKQYTTLEMLKTGQFYLLTFSLFCILPAYFILNPLLKSLAEARGLSPELAVLGVMITGIASASGRLINSWISDVIGRKMAIVAITVLTLVAILVMIFAQGVLFLICIAAISFGFGGAASVFASTTADLYGTKNIGLNYGCVMVGFGLSAVVFWFISRELVKQGEYTTSFLLAAATCIIALLLVIFIKVPKKGA